MKIFRITIALPPALAAGVYEAQSMFRSDPAHTGYAGPAAPVSSTKWKLPWRSDRLVASLERRCHLFRR
jgi:hypothetical protein